MAKSKTQKVVGHMTEKLQNLRAPMSLLTKILYWGSFALLLASVLVFPNIIKAVTGSYLLTIIPVLLFTAIVLGIVVIRKKKNSKLFWRVDPANVDKNISYVNISESVADEKMLEFYGDRAIVFGSKKEDIVPFIYNWFLTGEFISSAEKLNVYTLKLSTVRSKLEEKKNAKNPLPENMDLLIVDVNDLELSDEQMKKFTTEEGVIRPFRFSSWIDSNFIPSDEMKALYEDDEEDEYDEDEKEDEESEDESEEGNEE